MHIEQFKWKIIERPLIPVNNSYVDAAPFVALLLFFAVSIFFIFKFKKRQPIRHLVQLCSLFAFTFTFHRCFCTERGWIFGISEIGRDNLHVFQNMCVIIPIVASLFIFGRIFCGWICPLGFLQEILRKLNMLKGKVVMLSLSMALIIILLFNLKPVNFFIIQNVAALLGLLLILICFIALLKPSLDINLKKIKYFTLMLWAGFVALGVFVTSPWCAIYGNEIDYSSIIGFVAVLLSAAVISMAWCRYTCPLGGIFSILSRSYQYKIKGTGKEKPDYKKTCPMGAISEHGQVDRENCIYCLRCVEKYGFRLSDDKND